MNKIDDKKIFNKIERYKKEYPEFSNLYEALKFKLTNSQEKLGRPTDEGLPIVYRLYKQEGFISKDVNIAIIICYKRKNNNENYTIYILAISVEQTKNQTR